MLFGFHIEISSIIDDLIQQLIYNMYFNTK